MNFLEYQRLADQASDAFWLTIGGEMPSVSTRLAYVLLETHVRYMRELRLGDPIAIDTRLIAYDHRRLHLHHTLVRGEEAVSVVQILGLAFDLDRRRATRWSASMLTSLAAWRTDAPAAALNGVMSWNLASAPA
jgi:acyl-CoA thioester hydrolase